jgi:hypothetical protein
MREQPENLVLVGEFEVRGRVAKVPVWTVAATGKLPPDPAGEATGESQATPLTP